MIEFFKTLISVYSYSRRVRQIRNQFGLRQQLKCRKQNRIAPYVGIKIFTLYFQLKIRSYLSNPRVEPCHVSKNHRCGTY